MRYECVFEHRKTGEQRVVTVQLAAEEIDKAGGVALYRDAFLLRHAYAKVPAGFLHVPHAVRALAAH